MPENHGFGPNTPIFLVRTAPPFFAKRLFTSKFKFHLKFTSLGVLFAREIYHSVAEQGIPFRQIAESIAIGLSVPCVSLTAEEASEHFGWFFGFACIDQPTSSEWTRAQLGWNPTGPNLLNDLMETDYF